METKMIRELEKKDLDRVMELWLETNKKAHDFIKEEYWDKNFNDVKTILPQAEVYVFEEENMIQGFIGVDNGYIAGLFVSRDQQSKGIGKTLLSYIKNKYNRLWLKVYQKNTRAVRFYEKEGFLIEKEEKDMENCEAEFIMEWKA